MLRVVIEAYAYFMFTNRPNELFIHEVLYVKIGLFTRGGVNSVSVWVFPHQVSDHSPLPKIYDATRQAKAA